jgi:hypothetical protein
MCFYCGTFLQFGPALELRALTPADLNRIDRDTLAELEHVRELRFGRPA